MMALSAMAVPLAISKVRAGRERELRYALRELHRAIDKYKDMCDANYLGPIKAGTDCFPESLDVLVRWHQTPGPRWQEAVSAAAHSDGPVHAQQGLGNAQRSGRPQSAKLGRTKRVRRVQQDNGESPRWVQLFRLVTG